MVPLFRPLQVDSPVLVPLAAQPSIKPDGTQSLDTGRLQDARPDPGDDVLPTTGLKDDRVDARPRQQMREQESGGGQRR